MQPLKIIIQLPSLKLLLIYTASIFFNINGLISETSFITIIILLSVFIVYFYKKNGMRLMSICLTILLFLIFSKYVHFNQKEIIDIAGDKIDIVYGKIVDFPVIKSKTTSIINCKKQILKNKEYRQKYTVKILKMKLANGNIIDVNTKLIISSKYNFKYEKGDYVKIVSRFKSIHSIEKCPNFDYGLFLKRKGVSYLSYPNNKSDVVLFKKREKNILGDFVLTFRHYLVNLYDQNIQGQNKEIIKGLILGVREGIHENIFESFRKAGIIHILALSGLHVGLIAYFFYIVFSIFSIPKKWIYIIIAFILIFYVFVTGEKVSVIRAVTMYCCGVFVFILDRSKVYLNALFWAAFLVLFIDPDQLYMAGFQLSFLAAAGILLFFNNLKNIIYDKLKIAEHICRGKFKNNVLLVFKGFVELFILTFSAQILTIPVLIYHFKGLSIISVIANIPVIIITEILVAMGLFYPLISFSDYLLEIYSYNINFVIKILIKISQFMSNLPIAYVDDLSIASWMIIGYYSLIIFVIVLMDRNIKKEKILSQLAKRQRTIFFT